MTEILMIIVSILVIVLIMLNLISWKRIKNIDISQMYKNIDESLSGKLNDFNTSVKEEFVRNREEYSKGDKAAREELNNSMKLMSDQVFGRMQEISKMQKDQLDIFANQLSKLTETNEQKFDGLQEKVSTQLKEIQNSNEKKLEQMRETVDEKLHETLEKRLGDSFKVVSERLESVHKGLGDMQELARGVGDLKNVLANVKTRGTWGEVQLENLITQVLTLEQYKKNVVTKKGSTERVEFAIVLPGKGDDDEKTLIPVDAKFPLEDYQRLIEASEKADAILIESISKDIERRIKDEAKKIAAKYIDPPNTTDFAILFIPIEGLYAEILRRPGLSDNIQRDFKVTIAGPTNFLAILNSLQMGFRTLAIEKRSSEVWKTLSSVKTEFQKFGDILDKTQTKLEQASKSIGDAKVRTRAIERKLSDVQELPASDSLILLDEGDD